MALPPARWKFSVDDVHRMAQTEILSEDDRIELVEGEILEMAPIGRRHAACVSRLNELLMEAARKRHTLWSQNPLELDEHTELQPDLALLVRRADFYNLRVPTPADTLLVVVVADSSLEYDRRVKSPLYAQAMIPELWIVDLTHLAVEIYSQPLNGAYQSVQIVKGTDSLAAAGGLGLKLTAAEILE